MGKRVNVVLWDGTVRTVDEDLAKKLTAAGTGRVEGEGEAGARLTAEYNEENTSALAAGAEGFVDTATGGAWGALMGDGQAAHEMRARAQAHPTARTVGAVASIVAPTGMLGRGAKAITGATLPGAAAALGAGGKALGRVAEGAVLGVGAKFAETNITGDPLTIAGTLEAASIGGVLNYGVGLLGDKLLSAGKRAKAFVAKEDELRETMTTAAKGDELFAVSDPRYTEFKSAHDAFTKSVKSNNLKAANETLAYEAALTPKATQRAIDELKTQRARIQAEIAESAFAKQTDDGLKAAGKAGQDYQKALGKYEEFASSPSFAKAATEVDRVIDDLEKLYAGNAKRWDKVQKKASTGRGAARVGGEQGGDFGAGVKAEAAAGGASRGGDFGAGVKAQAAGESPFVAGIREASAKAAKFGDRKVFISSLYENMDPALRGASLGEFKNTLFKAHKSGKIVLSRADMVGAMDPEMVAASKLAVEGAHFNFVNIPEGAGAVAHAGAVGGEVAGAALPMADRLKAFRERRSIASKKLSGWKPEPGRWTGKAPPTIDEGMAELAQLQDDLLAEFRTGKAAAKLKPANKVPRRPEAPPGFSPGEVPDELRKLQAASQDISSTIDKALEHARAGRYGNVYDEIGAAEGRAKLAGMGNIAFPKLPTPPRGVNPVDVVDDLPKTVAQFARMTPDKAARLGQSVQKMDAAVGESFGKLADDLGVRRGATAEETIASVHKTLKGYAKAADDMKSAAVAAKAKAAAKTGDVSLLSKVGGWGKRGLQWSAGRAADGGGAFGGVQRAMAAGAVGASLEGTEGAVLGFALFSGKAGLRSKLAHMTAKLAPGAAKTASTLAPITAYLGARFPSGEADESDDPRQQAYNRIGDVFTAAQVAPDAAYTAVEHTLGHAGDIAWKTHQMIINAVNHLAQMAPRDPGIDVTLSGSNWRPSAEESIAYAHRIEAVVDPLSAIERSVSGDGHPAANETLWAVWSPLMEEFASEFLTAPHKMTYEAESRMAALLRVETGLQQPAVLTALQGMYLPPPIPPGGGGGSSSPGGRPAAYSSSVAGSSVSALTA